MNYRLYIMLFLGLVSFIITSSLSVLVIYIFLFIIGRQMIILFQNNKNVENTLLIFEMSYMIYFTYALICFLYMSYHGYDHLQSFDGINVYIPYTKELLNSNSFYDLVYDIYNTSKYAFVGAILILFVYIGKLSLLMDGELYVTIQLSIILFASWSVVLVYNLLVFFEIKEETALNSTLIYAFLSFHFYMSTFIVRDMPITFSFISLIYLSFQSFSIKNLLIMILLVFFIASIRVSSGIFASLYIFLLLIMSQIKGTISDKIIINIIFIFLIFILLFYMDMIKSIYLLKTEEYSSIEAAAGESTVGAFNVLPSGIKEFSKAFYNQIMPIPSWQIMLETVERPESYNIMNFPVVSATFFRYCMWSFIILGFLTKEIRIIIVDNKILFYNFLIAILFISIQSNTMGFRRVLGVYPIFFLIAILVYEKLNIDDKKRVFEFSFILFTFLQIIGFLKLL